MPEAWAEGRNLRRQMPDGIGSMRFRGLQAPQKVVMDNAVRKMKKDKTTMP